VPAPSLQSPPVSWASLAVHRPWKQALCAAAVLFLCLTRVPHLWSAGEFVAEDYSVFFAAAWTHDFPRSLFQPYAGYFHLLPRLLAELWSVLPLIWQPFAYAASGLAINAIILSAFYLPCFRPVLPSDAARLVIVALLAFAPNAENLGLLLGLHWYLAFLLVLLV
jgi:hypothetical protein